MRLDLFLKIGRLAKRRTAAQELCDSGRVLVNGQPAKPARTVRPGDRITLHYPSRTVEIEVLSLPASTKRPATEPPFRVASETRHSDECDPWARSSS